MGRIALSGVSGSGCPACLGGKVRGKWGGAVLRMKGFGLGSALGSAKDGPIQERAKGRAALLGDGGIGMIYGGEGRMVEGEGGG